MSELNNYNRILTDTARISSVRISSTETVSVGRDCISIEAYPEGAMHSDIPWVEVVFKNGSSARFCSHHLLGIYYNEDK